MKCIIWRLKYTPEFSFWKEDIFCGFVTFFGHYIKSFFRFLFSDHLKNEQRCESDSNCYQNFLFFHV